MTIIQIATKEKDRLLNILSNEYHLAVTDYEIKHSEGDVTVIEIYNDDRHYDARPYIALEDGGVQGFITIYPAIGSGRKLSLDEIKAAIAEEGIHVNIDQAVIEQVAKMHNENMVIEDRLFAEGTAAKHGKDAVITINFAKIDHKPKITEDGKVDFKSLDNIIHAKHGDVLISKRPATQGVRGMTVKNSILQPIPGKDIELTLEEGVALNATGTSYIATHDGYIEFDNNILAVHEVFFVNNNVDFTTGNIKFNGTVHVKGDVLPGFKVEADKNVIVEGICQDCEISAKKNIVLTLGIKGTGTNKFTAGGDAHIGYCEKAVVHAKGNIYIKKYAYNSELFSGGKIEATTAEGVIAGGHLKAFSEIKVKQLGTQGNSRFNVYVGTKFYIDSQLEKMRKEKAKLLGTIGKMQEVLSKFNIFKSDVANNPRIKRLLEMKKDFENIIAEMTAVEETLLVNSKAKKPKIKVTGVVYEGVVVLIYNCSSTVREKIENAVFYLDDKYAEVAWVSLKDAKNYDLE